MKRIACFWLMFFCPFVAFAEIEVRDLQGRDMKVEILKYTASSGNTRIKRLPDGAIFNVKIAVFDAASQEKIKVAAPRATADLLATVSVGRRRERLGDSSYMKKQTISAKAVVENDSRDIDFTKGKGTILLVARQTKRYADDGADYGQILYKENFENPQLGEIYLGLDVGKLVEKNLAKKE